jgi:membrane protease YdiL (CAAX protease family)
MDTMTRMPQEFGNRRVVWIIVSILLGIRLFNWAWTAYVNHVVTRNDLAMTLRSTVRGTISYPIFLLIIFAFIIFLPTQIGWKRIIISDSMVNAPRARARSLAEALAASCVVLLMCLPLFLYGPKPYTVADLAPGLWMGQSSHLEQLFVIGLFGLVMPFALEVIFRGILFSELMTTTGPLAASVALSLLYAFVWSIPGFISSLLMSMGACFVYYRTRSFIASFITNFVFTLSSSAVIIWLRMR